MKKRYDFLYIGSILLLLFIVVSVCTFHYSSSLIQKGYLASEGSAAENFAVLTAANIKLSDEQVAALKQYDYEQLQNSPENQALKAMMNNENFINKVDYAYIMVHLKDEEVKYQVTKENSSQFDAPEGTKLDIMWLLDVNVNEEAASLDVDADLQRYSYYIEEDALIFGEAPTYLYNSSEWGDHICGYAPLYSTQGRYIGVVGVELQTSDYHSYCDRAMYAMGFLMAASLLMLTLLFLYIYRKYRKIQFEKIYTDALTGIYNRSYYNNLFIKQMNERHNGGCAALMIADVDWFKKVNDTFGHEIGDKVLIEVGEILVNVFGKERVIRFGGEEFVVGLWCEDEAALRLLLDKLFAQIAAHKFSSQEISLSLSLGCCYCQTKELNGWLLSGMLRAADARLYEAKENGRRHYRIQAFDEKKNTRSDTM